MDRPTLQSIADEVGVSRMTVSNAFSRPDQLSEALRSRILEVAERVGYLGPDPAGRSLATGSSGTVGVLWPKSLAFSLRDEVSTRFLGGIADELAPDGAALTMLPPSVPGPSHPVRDVALDGAIVYSCPPDLPALDWLRRRRIPLVVVDMDDGSPAVRIDDRGGARAAAEHLLALGHRQIGIIATGMADGVEIVTDTSGMATEPSRVLRERFAGWSSALAAAGVEPVVVNQPRPTEDSRPAAGLLFGRVSAVLCLIDLMAYDVLAAAAERGIAVPTEISVVGFDDHPLAARTHPGLTTVRQDAQAKGQLAARALRSLLDGGHPESVDLRVELVVRGSTAPPAGRFAAS